MRCDKLASALQHHNALRGETAKSCDSGLSTKVGAKLPEGLFQISSIWKRAKLASSGNKFFSRFHTIRIKIEQLFLMRKKIS